MITAVFLLIFVGGSTALYVVARKPLFFLVGLSGIFIAIYILQGDKDAYGLSGLMLTAVGIGLLLGSLSVLLINESVRKSSYLGIPVSATGLLILLAGIRLLLLIRRLPRDTIIKQDIFKDDNGGELRVFHRVFMEDNLTKDFFDKLHINLSGVSKYDLRVYCRVSNSLTQNFDPDKHQADSDKVLSMQFFSKITYRKGKVHYLNQQSEEEASDDEYSIAIKKSKQTTEETSLFNTSMIEMGQNVVERLTINDEKPGKDSKTVWNVEDLADTFFQADSTEHLASALQFHLQNAMNLPFDIPVFNSNIELPSIGAISLLNGGLGDYPIAINVKGTLLAIKGQSLRSETVKRKILAYTDPFHRRSKLRGQMVFVIREANITIPKNLPNDEDILM